MATLRTISEALNLIETKKQNLKKAFENLQSQSSFLHSIPLSWLELDSHFTSLQHSLTHRFHLLQSLEQSQSKTLTSNPNGPTSKDAKFIDNPIERLCFAYQFWFKIVQKLVDKGKHVLAVKYVFEFNLAHKIPPVPILKAGVDEAKNIARRLSQEGKPRKEIINREIQSLKSIIAAIENHKLESEYPRASLNQRIEELKEHEKNMKHKTPGELKEHETNMKHKKIGSIRTQLRLQSRKKKRSMKKLQKIENKLRQTFTSVGPEAVLKNVSNNNSTIYEYQQPPVNPSGLFPQHPNPPYMTSRAMPPRMVIPTPTVPSYAGPSAGPYGFAGIHTGPNGNSSLGGSQLSSSGQHVPFAYGGTNLRPHYQASYYPQ